MTIQKKLSPDEQKNLDDCLIKTATFGKAQAAQALLAAGANARAANDGALREASLSNNVAAMKVLLAAGADAHTSDDVALRRAVCFGYMETVQLLAEHIFAPDLWRGKSRADIEAQAGALYDKIKGRNSDPEHVRQAGTILADSALDCWFQVRPPPPKLQISPLPAQPKPV